MRSNLARVTCAALLAVLTLSGHAHGAAGNPSGDGPPTHAAARGDGDPESAQQPASEKLLWGVVLSCISVVLFAVGNDGYALVKAHLNGARQLWGWHGQWIGQAVCASLFVPERFRERMYLTVREQGYTLVSRGHDDEGGGWGTLLCTSGKHPIGGWELRANRRTLNLPELTLKFNNGQVQSIVFKRAT